MPVIAYRVKREGSGMLTERPLLLGVHWSETTPQFVDVHAPEDQELLYRVSSVDIFGRSGEAAAIKATLPASLAPPLELKAEANPGVNHLLWSAAESVAVSGYVVERSVSVNGSYSALMEHSLTTATLTFNDAQVEGGTTYYYRVRSVSSAGNQGPPSMSTFAQARNATPPPAPADVRVQLGADRVLVAWSPVAFCVAGYWTERRTNDDSLWHRINEHPWPEPSFEDRQQGGFGGRLYRIVAIAFDNQESEPSTAVEVAVPDTSQPTPPIVTALSGADGRVQLYFLPSGRAEKSAQFLVVRGDNPSEEGLVIGDPLPADARHFEDTFVTIGNYYYYKLYAVDAAGVRSEPSQTVGVHVGSPQLPAPDAPTVVFGRRPLRAEISFSTPSEDLVVIVQVRTASAKAWTTLSGPVEMALPEAPALGVAPSGKFVDLDPPTGEKASYRVLYQAADGSCGPGSVEVPLEVVTE